MARFAQAGRLAEEQQEVISGSAGDMLIPLGQIGAQARPDS
jgi:hypothetical protein